MSSKDSKGSSDSLSTKAKKKDKTKKGKTRNSLPFWSRLYKLASVKLHVWTALFRILRGNGKQFEIAGVRNIRKWMTEGQIKGFEFEISKLAGSNCSSRDKRRNGRCLRWIHSVRKINTSHTHTHTHTFYRRCGKQGTTGLSRNHWCSTSILRTEDSKKFMRNSVVIANFSKLPFSLTRIAKEHDTSRITSLGNVRIMLCRRTL